LVEVFIPAGGEPGEKKSDAKKADPGDKKTDGKQPDGKKSDGKKPEDRKPGRVGTVKALSTDGRSFTLQPAPTEKNKEPAAIDIQISEHTTITAGKEPGKLAVGQTVSVWFGKGSADVAVEIQIGKPPKQPEKKPAPEDKGGKPKAKGEKPAAKGEKPAPDANEKKPGDKKPGEKKPGEPHPDGKKTPEYNPDLVGTVKAVSGDGKSFTLLRPPNAKRPEPAPVDIQLDERTRVTDGKGAGKLAVGQTVSVWLGKSDTPVALIIEIGKPSDKPDKPAREDKRKKPEPGDKKPDNKKDKQDEN
jgi:hypothetical protein